MIAENFLIFKNFIKLYNTMKPDVLRYKTEKDITDKSFKLVGAKIRYLPVTGRQRSPSHYIY